MNKSAPINKAGQPGKVLADKTPVKGSQDSAASAPVATTSDDGKTKKNQAIKVAYLADTNGSVTASAGIPSTGFIGVRIGAPGMADMDLAIADLPREIIQSALAFGLNTAIRNAFNTRRNTVGVTDDEAREFMLARVDGWKRGEWSQRGEATPDNSVPLVIEAMIRATKAAGVHTQAKEDGWLAHYRGLPDAKAKAKQTAEWLKKTAVNAAFEAIKAERAAARAEAAKGRSTPAASADLGDL
jgi:hypothetical protein